MRRLTTFDWAIKRLLRSKVNSMGSVLDLEFTPKSQIHTDCSLPNDIPT
jgi:hypothetical protein